MTASDRPCRTIGYGRFLCWFLRGGDLECSQYRGKLSTSFGLLVSYVALGILMLPIGHWVSALSERNQFPLVLEVVLFLAGLMGAAFVVSFLHFVLLRLRAGVR